MEKWRQDIPRQEERHEQNKIARHMYQEMELSSIRGMHRCLVAGQDLILQPMETCQRFQRGEVTCLNVSYIVKDG